MAAIVRVKRRLNEDPVDSLLLSCKRFKSNETVEKENDTGEVKSVFKFAGTLPSKNVDVESHVLEAIRREKLQREYKRHLVDIPTRTRKTHIYNSTKNRFKVVSAHRSYSLPGDKNTASSHETNLSANAESINKCSQSDGRQSQKDGVDDESPDLSSSSCLESTGQSASASSVFCLFDIEGQLANEESVPKLIPGPAETITCNGLAMVRETVKPANQSRADDNGYVYDIYYMNSPKFDFRNLENILAIEALREDLVAEEQGRRDSEEEYGEDEDSNDENNWRNDYPDEDDELFADTIDFDDEADDYRCQSEEDACRDSDSYTEDFGVSRMIGRRLKICDEDDDDEFSISAKPESDGDG